MTAKTQRGTIAIHFVQEAVGCLEARGLDAEPFLARAGIPVELLTQPLARVVPAQFGALWLDIAKALDDEFFGLDRHAARVGTYALMCASVLPCTSLGQALRRVLGFMRLVLDDLRGELVVQGASVHVRLRDGGGPQRLFAHATFFIMVYGLACWLVGRRIPLQAVQFASPPPGGGTRTANEYRVLFCEALTFDAANSSLSFAATHLNLVPIRGADSLREHLRGAPANFLVKYRNPRSLAARLRRRLREQAPLDWPTFEDVCVQWGYTEATLRRRLREEGHSFQSIKDELRRDMALTLMQDAERPLADVAAAVGFAEVSGFHRAFKKWTGTSPSDYRSVGVDTKSSEDLPEASPRPRP